MKRCPRCNIEKCTTDFYSSRKDKSHLYTPCKECYSAIAKSDSKKQIKLKCQKRYYRNNRDKLILSMREYERTEKRMIAQKEYRKNKITNLSDDYIRSLIRGNIIGLTKDKIPKELIEAKRCAILLKRELKYYKNDNSNPILRIEE